MVERCALSGSDLNIKFRTILLTSIPNCRATYITSSIARIFRQSGTVSLYFGFSKNDPFILDIKFVVRTSRGHTGGRSHRISHPPSFCGACLNFSGEKDSAIPFPRRP